MSIKSTLTKAAEKITGRKCTRCLHNRGGRCCHPNGRMFMKCWQSITRPGFEKRPARFLKYEDVVDTAQLVEKAKQHLAAIDQPTHTYELNAVDLQHIDSLTPEEQYQLEKIKNVLQEAEDSARESGLLEG